ncbi:hypothetical protein, partial [Telmatospirillum siberiense]
MTRNLLWGMPTVCAVLTLAAAASHGAEDGGPSPRLVDIYEYRVEGARTLPVEEVEAAVYPFLGPGKT